MRHGQQAAFVQQQAHGRGDGAAGGLHHVLHTEVQPTGTLTARGGDEAQRGAVEEQASRGAGAAQEAFHAAVGGGIGAVLGADYGVEALGGGGGGDEELPRGLCGTVALVCGGDLDFSRRLAVSGLVRCGLAHGELRAQHLARIW